MEQKCNRWLFGHIRLSLALTVLTVMMFPRLVLPTPPNEPAELVPIPHSFLAGVSNIKAIAARFSPDGRSVIILAPGPDKYQFPSDDMSLWNLQTGQMVWSVKNAHVAKVKFSADGKTIACSEVTGKWPGFDAIEIRLRNALTGKPLPQPTFRFDSVPGFALSPDGRILAACWDDYSSGPVPSPDSKYWSKKSDRGYKVHLLDTATGKSIYTFDGIDFSGEWDVAFSPDGNYLAARPADNNSPGYNLDCPSLIVWETVTRRCVYRKMDSNYTREGMFETIPVSFDAAFFTSNERLIFSNSILDLDHKPLSVHTMLQGTKIHYQSQEIRLFVGFIDQIASEQHRHSHLALFYDKYLTDKLEGVVKFEFWDIETKRLIKTVPQPPDYYASILDYSPVTKLVAHCSHDGIFTLQRPE